VGLWLVISCEKNKEGRPIETNGVGLIPMLAFDRDTIAAGDSLTGIVGGVFESGITEERKQQLITTMAYRIDTTETPYTDDMKFYRTRRINDTTFRFALLPQYQSSATTKRSIYVAIRIENIAEDMEKNERIFQNQFNYFITK
jgi:hypothetical protein